MLRRWNNTKKHWHFWWVCDKHVSAWLSQPKIMNTFLVILCTMSVQCHALRNLKTGGGIANTKKWTIWKKHVPPPCVPWCVTKTGVGHLFVFVWWHHHHSIEVKIENKLMLGVKFVMFSPTVNFNDHNQKTRDAPINFKNHHQKTGNAPECACWSLHEFLCEIWQNGTNFIWLTFGGHCVNGICCVTAVMWDHTHVCFSHNSRWY